MKKIAGVPLIIIGGALVLLAMLIEAEDDEDDVLTDVLIAYPMLLVGSGMMFSGARFLMGDVGAVQTSKRATSERQPSILSPPTNTPSVSEVMQQVPVAIRLATIENSIGMKLVLIPADKFMIDCSVSEIVPRDIPSIAAEFISIGCPADQAWAAAQVKFEQEMAQWHRIKIQRAVSIASSFSLGVYEVTQSQYESVMGENPSRFQGGTTRLSG